MKIHKLKGAHELDLHFQFKIVDSNLYCDNKLVLWAWVYNVLGQKYKESYETFWNTIQQQNRLDIGKWPKNFVLNFLNRIRLQQVPGIKTLQQAKYLWTYIASIDLKVILEIKQQINEKNIKFVAFYYDDHQLLYQKIKNFEIKSLQTSRYFQQTSQIINQIIKKPQQIYTSLEKIADSQAQQLDPWAKQNKLYIYGNFPSVHNYIQKFVYHYNKIKLEQLDRQDPNFGSYLYCYLKTSQRQTKKMAKLIKQPKLKLYLLFHVDYCKLKKHFDGEYATLKFDQKLQKMMNQDKQFKNMIHFSKELSQLTFERIDGEKSSIERIKQIIHQQLPFHSFQQLKQKKMHKFIDTQRLNITKENFRYLLTQFDQYKLADQIPFFISFKSNIQITNFLQFRSKIFLIFKEPEQIINLQSVIKGFEMELKKYLPILQFFNSQQEQKVYRHAFQYGSEFIFIRRENKNSWDEHIIKTIHKQNSLTKAIVINCEYFTQFLNNSHKIQNFCTVAIENGNLADAKMKLEIYQKQIKQSRVNAISISKTTEERKLLQLVQQLLNKNVKKYSIKQACRQGDTIPVGLTVDPITSYNITIRCLKQYQSSSIPIPIDKTGFHNQYICLTYYSKILRVKRNENYKLIQLQEVQDFKRQFQRMDYNAFQRLNREALFFGYQFFLLYANKTLSGIESVNKIQENLTVYKQVDYYTLKYWQRTIQIKKSTHFLRTIKHNQNKCNQAKLKLEQIIKQKYWPLTSKIPIQNKKAIQFIASANIGYGVFKKLKDPKNSQIVYFQGSYYIIPTIIEKLLRELK